MSEMDVLSLLDEVAKTVLIKRHPLADEDISLRFAYAVGIGMVARADGPLNETEQTALKDLTTGLLIPEEQTNKVLSAASTSGKATVIELLGALTRRDQQYLFLLDLRAMAIRDGGASESEQKAIEKFAALFKMSGAEIALWLKLDAAVFAEDFAASEKLFQEVYKGKEAGDIERTGLVPYRVLAYFWRSEAIRDELAACERVVTGLKENMEKAVAEAMDIGPRPEPRKYARCSGGKKRYEDDKSGGIASAILVAQNKFNEIDDSAGIAWDEAVTKKKQLAAADYAPRIIAAETRRDRLATAIDGMYVSNLA